MSCLGVAVSGYKKKWPLKSSSTWVEGAAFWLARKLDPVLVGCLQIGVWGAGR
jgi:hypothetical protein